MVHDQPMEGCPSHFGAGEVWVAHVTTEIPQLSNPLMATILTASAASGALLGGLGWRLRYTNMPNDWLWPDRNHEQTLPKTTSS